MVSKTPLGDHVLLTKFSSHYDSFTKYMNTCSKIKISTLGPMGTSSEACAKFIADNIVTQDAEYLLFSTYEKAHESLLRNESDLLLVANAYQGIDTFYMNSSTRLLFYFVQETPLYGIAKREDTNLSEKRTFTIATHHAPVSLIPWFLEDYDVECEIKYVNSTSEAALKLKNKEVDLCVTTEIASKLHNVSFITRTRPITMLWSLFAKS